MHNCAETCGYLIVYASGFILFFVGLSLSSSKHLPALFWISLFGPILVPICWAAIILPISWMVKSVSKMLSSPRVSAIETEITPPVSSTPLGEPQGPEGIVINQQNGQHESSNTVSISPSLAASFPTYIYLKEASKGDQHCSLCKKLLRQWEVATRVPICIHSFHKSCIDTWLKANISCPDCGLKLDPLPGEVALEVQ